uniref:Multiple epidermal growth factor-like domains protein 11 isoform X2 n=1 Tax=Crassostrea virginica TaxID=6565 RepID=A0A8B8C2X9_CRAVI|nr:multiple epidermal growth factor-like domains protein 11 isoform X2 [Crassostrea virginica]
MFWIYIYLGYFTLTVGYENLALHKPAYQLHPYKKSFVSQADAAVDGLKNNTDVWGDQCIISEKGKYIALWWVNLTSISSIHHITVYYVTGRKKWGPGNSFAKEFLGFAIYVSNTTEKEDGVLCFKDTKSTINDITPVFNITCPVHGQYVIYYNERKGPKETSRSMSEHAFNDLCEVEVYGCPDPTYYGNDCSKRCPDPNCSYCHIETGACPGCKPGYQGHNCNLACGQEMCGDNITQPCEHCLHPSSCSHVDGICENGCEAGYHGRFCDTKCDTGFFGSDCKHECSRTCKIPRKCNHITGVCEDGCQPGWQGLECTGMEKNTQWQTATVVLVTIIFLSLLTYGIIKFRKRCMAQIRNFCASRKSYTQATKRRNERGSDGSSTHDDLHDSDEEAESNYEEIKEEDQVIFCNANTMKKEDSTQGEPSIYFAKLQVSDFISLRRSAQSD